MIYDVTDVVSNFDKAVGFPRRLFLLLNRNFLSNTHSCMADCHHFG